jgi:hypothetical protein
MQLDSWVARFDAAPPRWSKDANIIAGRGKGPGDETSIITHSAGIGRILAG